jgi:flagellar basal-body rod protein FlgC
MSFWNMLRIGSSALSAQRLRLDLISNNIANIETTHTEAGGPYRRQDVRFQAVESGGGFRSLIRARLSGRLQAADETGGVKVSEILEDDRPGPRVYDPGHPDADEEGYVEYPNVDLAVEMTNMLSATRSYEANLTVINAAKRMALKSLEIGK